MARRKRKHRLYDEHHRLAYVEPDDHPHSNWAGFILVLLLVGATMFALGLLSNTQSGRDWIAKNILRSDATPTELAARRNS